MIKCGDRRVETEGGRDRWKGGREREGEGREREREREKESDRATYSERT